MYLNERWLKYHHLCVRQLAFCIASPNILASIPKQLNLKYEFELHSDSHWLEFFNAYRSRLDELDQDPRPLELFLSQLKSTRLGLQFEMYLWFWLLDSDYHPYTLLDHSIQIIEDKQTIGELDFLVYNRIEHRVEHWEVALKYYLAENCGHLNEWFGLNKKDTLQRKLQHFTNKQFQFSYAKDRLIEKKFAVLKGQLFVPNRCYVFPNWVNTSRRIGLWGIKPLPHFYRLKRNEWITPENKPSSLTAVWWMEGLYCRHNHFYMYRKPSVFP